MEQGGGQGQGQYQHYHSYSSHSPSPSQGSSSNGPPPPPAFGTPVSSGYSDAAGGSSQPSLQHAYSETSALLPPPTFHSHAHHGHAHGPHQPNAGEHRFYSFLYVCPNLIAFNCSSCLVW
jgi:hypothetical protein